MSKGSTISNNDNIENTSKKFENAFPDPTEDVFWQKVSTVISENDDSSNDIDAIWNPHKKELNQQNEREENNFVIAPPPHHPVTNNYTRHSRKSSRVSWGLQTDSECHVELLEKKLNEVISNHKPAHSKSISMDLGGIPSSSLGYYPEEEVGSGTVFENEEDLDIHTDNHNPQESDEGLWLLWKNQPVNNFQNDEQHDDTSTTNQSWYLPILSSPDNNNNNITTNNNLSRVPRMRNENYVTNYRENSDELNEFPYYDEDEEDGYSLNEEVLLHRAKRKKEKEYLMFNARSYECCGCNTTNGLFAGWWEGWCCNWVCLPAILFVREKCCGRICGIEDD